jgi:hypothetical protein
MKNFFFTLLVALSMLCPSFQLNAFISEDDEASLDQVMVTMSTSGYILDQAIDLAKENHFRYLKILSAEYTLGSQSGGFTCQADDEPTGKILMFEDDMIKIVISCYNSMPENTDYIDAEIYRDRIQVFEDEEDELSFDSQGDFSFGHDNDLSFDDDDEND